MRMHQYIGLNDRARKWLEKHAQKVPGSRCSHCNQVLSTILSRRVYSTDEIFYDTLSLYEYTLTDGTVVREVLQDQPWSSGPMSFLCLEIEGKQRFKWSRKEIEGML